MSNNKIFSFVIVAQNITPMQTLPISVRSSNGYWEWIKSDGFNFSIFVSCFNGTYWYISTKVIASYCPVTSFVIIWLFSINYKGKWFPKKICRKVYNRMREKKMNSHTLNISISCFSKKSEYIPYFYKSWLSNWFWVSVAFGLNTPTFSLSWLP